MISLDKCNAVDDLSPKICVPRKTKHVNVKVSNNLTKLKIKEHWHTNKRKMKNNELSKVSAENRTCYYFDKNLSLI